MLAMGLSDPFEPPKPGTMQPEKDSKKEFDESRELFAKDYIISSSVSDRDIQDLRWATRNGEDPKASAIISVVAKNMEAVETTVKRKGFARAIVWAEEHLTDPRARCIVELTDKWRKRSKADLAKMDALARRKH
jgi:hypothetical protein